MDYVDGCVLAVPTKNKTAYIEHATKAAKLFKKHGATRLVECWGEDVPEGKLTSFPMAVQCKDDETVVLTWITWPSREVRDVGMKSVMEEWGADGDDNPMPFDGARMIFGGFQMIVDE
ncbi:Uncharacterized conserved protein YbaA, DUF1428 family [Marinobacter sp. LV10R510-11A]|uniref:DUF1428 domain-containing protein n=1 Tax=Marinobacter sp. LV10R510-11A TaxID=1415568 RepID=UPI000BB6B6EC|nr:DUF1428 domain-containing protein [Marinobacter sp. LV10R510-11A]SOB76288.1 Uncharacterized conserved protein YbaA, DUF1428 family [Marinobacter sp. LV10R510-11A]